MKNQGFSRIGLAVVVVILLLLAAIAIPNLIRCGPRYNEQYARGSLASINKAEITYKDTNNSGFTDTLTKLAQAGNDSFRVLSTYSARNSFVRFGYTFTYTPGPGAPGSITTYTVHADPVDRGETGYRSFYSDQSGVIRRNYKTRAGPDDEPVQASP